MDALDEKVEENMKKCEVIFLFIILGHSQLSHGYVA